MTTRVRMKQCSACPWKKSTVPSRDIPGGYDPKQHANLIRCQSDGSGLFDPGPMRMMACHESRGGQEYVCTGWMENQLGPGNNLALRFAASRGRFGSLRDLRTEGEQYESLEEMCATSGLEEP